VFSAARCDRLALARRRHARPCGLYRFGAAGRAL